MERFLSKFIISLRTNVSVIMHHLYISIAVMAYVFCLLTLMIYYLVLCTKINIFRRLEFYKPKKGLYMIGGIPLIQTYDFAFFDKYLFSALTFFILTTLFCGSISFYFLMKSLTVFSNIWYFIIPLIIVSIIFFFSPILMLLFSIICSGFLLNLTFSSFFTKWISSKLSSSNIIFTLHDLGVLSFFFRLFSYVFSISSSRQFWLILMTTHLLSFFYVLFSRFYIFIFVILTLPLPMVFYLLLLCAIFFCLIGVIARLLINMSIVITFATINNQYSLWESFLQVEPYFDPNKNVPSNVSVGPFARFNQNINFHNYPGGTPPRLTAWKGFGYGIGLCTLGVSCVIGYYTYQHVLESRKQTLEAQRQTFEAREANRLKRWEMATARPKDADNIFQGYPEELNSFKNKK